MGAKTGLYAIPANQSAYLVRNGKITIKDKEYDIKLPDGYYIIRKLTVTECCRLQGLPDWWFLDSEGNKILSDTRAYEAHVVPRSSTFKNFGIIQTNSIGIIDNSYSGTNDIWKMPIVALRDTIIRKNDRICQFRIVRKMPKVEFKTVETLDDIDRGGFGSTGTR